MPAVIKNFIKYRTFLVTVVVRDIKKKYYKSVLGMAWCIVDPVLHTLVYFLVFDYLLGRSIPNFPLYLMSGRTIFQFTISATTVSMHSIGKNSGIINKIYVPKYMFVVSDLSVAFINMLLTFIPLLVLVFIYRVPFTVYWLLLPCILIISIFFTLGLCLILSAYGLFYKDLVHLYGIITSLWFYLTPIFYTLDRIDPRYWFLWRLNPLMHFVHIFRDIVYSSTAPSPENFLIAGIYALLTFCLGCVIFNECQDRFLLYL